MSKSISVASVATTALSALAFLSASATSIAAVRTVDESSKPVLIASPDVAAQPEQDPASSTPNTTISASSASDQIANGAAPLAVAESAAAPDVTPRSLAALVAAQPANAALDNESHCLATAVYYESRSESLMGQLAVARVVINRAQSGRFPSSLCGVVTQPRQFSFVRGGRLPTADRNSAQWRNASAIARIALQDGWESHVEGALFFHATRVAPGWNRQRMAQVGNHVFYR
jgi:N-acetylmuramoyl-L-alanine amidase